jgi:hypothetical protein
LLHLPSELPMHGTFEIGVQGERYAITSRKISYF